MEPQPKERTETRAPRAADGRQDAGSADQGWAQPEGGGEEELKMVAAT
jgi:hypothetical protein